MTTKKPGFLIAAPTSGSGKTTIARGLMELLTRRGLRVQPFKCGPDYIDTKFHEAVCGRPSINLDSFMATSEHVRWLYAHYSERADICIVEGMMGLFDGYDHDLGSSAEIARVLGLPVVLVVDVRSAAYSVAPLLKGFANFRDDVHLCGVIFNKVGSPRHYQMLQQVCEELHILCLGYLPKCPDLEQPSRYLGLDFSKSASNDKLLQLLEEYVDVERLMAIDHELLNNDHLPLNIDHSKFNVTALVARNSESFSFIYQETLDAYARVRFFDPETEVPDFNGIDLLYLPGGYPEKHAEALTHNEAARQAIKAYAERGGHIVAECGGMMYLCQSIITDDGEYPMCGVLPHSITARQADRKLSLGYRRFELNGREFRGHEFHYTQFFRGNEQKEIPSAVQVYNAKGEPMPTPVFCYKNVLASYTHLYPIDHEPFLRTFGGKRPQGAIDCEAKSINKERLHPLMFVGTGSDVGKSVIAAAFCRIFKQDGYHPAPFKAQNMALNSYATPDGLEIGRAQAVQAEAAGIPCHTDMNPLLLKPQSDHTSQVVLHGKPIGNRDAYDYWRRSDDEAQEPQVSQKAHAPHDSINFRREVCTAFDRLASKYNPIIMEGAGSISEINLRHTDLVNMPMARHAGADVILVGDIDRGGVFASVYGSILLQKPEDRRYIKGIIINKFRGDMKLFDEGRQMLERLCGIPVLGVIPYMNDLHIEEEDSVALAGKNVNNPASKEACQNKLYQLKIAVIMLRHLSNYTDFDALEQDSRVHLFYTNNVDDIGQTDIIILPGTKSTLDDLYELRRNGCAQAIVRAHRRGATVMGICGGYQMMGIEVCDPDHVEGDIERLPGLGLLPMTTTMNGRKVTQQVEFTLHDSCAAIPELGLPTHSLSEPSVSTGQSTPLLKGYEIHNGETRPFGDETIEPFATLSDGRLDGCFVNEQCMGTYIHGVLDNQAVVDMLLKPFADKIGKGTKPFDYQAFKEQQYNLLADHVRQHVDMKRLHAILTSTAR